MKIGLSTAALVLQYPGQGRRVGRSSCGIRASHPWAGSCGYIFYNQQRNWNLPLLNNSMQLGSGWRSREDLKETCSNCNRSLRFLKVTIRFRI